MTAIVCKYCGKKSDKPSGSTNRVLRGGKNVYCNHKCFGFDKRRHYSLKERKKLKADYDKERRKKIPLLIKKKKAESFQKNYNPVKAAIIRKERMAYHVKYCQSPEYREKKRIYDVERRSKKQALYFHECWCLLVEIDREVKKIMPDKYERLKMRGLLERIRNKKRLTRR